jgi:oligosaccharide repeat unit polymerase
MGYGMDAGSILIANPSIRPFGQFSLFYGTLVASYTLIRAVRLREPDMIALTVLLFVELAMFGSRSSLLNVAIGMIIVGMIGMGRRLKLYWILGGVVGGLGLAIFLDALRRPDFSLQRTLAGSMLGIFYGNSFSDVRDFAVVLSFWDGKFLWGKTYLAGLMAFVPQTLSSFRAQWSIGVVTATLVGFDPTSHPGLRTGISGEAYLNFGIPGVVAVGLIAGAIIRLVDSETKRALRLLPRSNLRAYSFWVILALVGVAENSSGASGIYTTMLLLWLSWLFVRVFGDGKGNVPPRQAGTAEAGGTA